MSGWGCEGVEVGKEEKRERRRGAMWGRGGENEVCK